MFVGIDTGGTFTDAVLFDPGAGAHGAVVNAAKARTRHDDLTMGIGEALEQVLTVPASDVHLVSLSTTLATNALVEGVGGRIGLIYVGFSEGDLERAGLAAALGDDPVLYTAGGHDSFGTPLAALNLPALAAEVDRVAADRGVTSWAVTSQFSVRNPDHELAVRDLLVARGWGVTCSHELTAKLNGPKRALTCVLNARLIGMISTLCTAAESIMAKAGIDAPLMLVRGDGSLVTSAFARARPIETILSGPAASLIGARWLTGESNAVVSDIGGTTTDIAVLRDGEPELSETGAVVGGHQTMVEAIRMYTHGLGGDSEVAIDDRSFPAKLGLGPRRLVPLSVLAESQPELVHNHLDARTWPPRATDCRFFARAVSGDSMPLALSEREQPLFDRLADGWVAADKVLSGHLQTKAMDALVRRGVVKVAGFTPTDAARVLGRISVGDREAAHKAATYLASASDSRGTSVAEDAEAFATWVIATLTRRSAEVILDAAFAEDGIAESSLLPLVQRAIDGHAGTAKVHIGLDLPVIGLGASAATYYPAVAELLGAAAIIPDRAEVANAIGAVVGQVRVSRTATVTQPSKGLFLVHHPAFDNKLGDLDAAVAQLTQAVTADVVAEAAVAGADDVTCVSVWDAVTAMVEGREVFVEGTVTVTASGRPRIGG